VDILSEAKADIRLNKSYSSITDDKNIDKQKTKVENKQNIRPVSPLEKIEVRNLNTIQKSATKS
jgi:hypothetical protein